MIELKLVYAGRAREIFDLGGGLQPQLHEVMHFMDRALPEALTTAVFKAWDHKPFCSTNPLKLRVEEMGQRAESYDVFLWVYVNDGFIYPTLEAAKFCAPANRWPVQ